MAYRKAPAKRTSKAGGGGYRKGAGGSGYRAKRAAGTKASAGAGGRSGVQTVRIVIEQPGASAVSRPGSAGAGVSVSTTPRKSPF